MDIKLGLYGTYFNQLSQALEPFIEPWSIKVQNIQKFEKSIPEYKIWSNEFLDINLTFGMAVTIREIKARVLEKTFLMEEQMKKEEKAKEKQAHASTVIDDSVALFERQSTMQVKQGKKNIGYQFYNYTGADLKFCIHNLDVDENMNQREQENPLQRQQMIAKINIQDPDKISSIEGHRYNSENLPILKDHSYFNKQL